MHCRDERSVRYTFILHRDPSLRLKNLHVWVVSHRQLVTSLFDASESNAATLALHCVTGVFAGYDGIRRVFSVERRH